jgi:hypothetical protein
VDPAVLEEMKESMSEARDYATGRASVGFLSDRCQAKPPVLWYNDTRIEEGRREMMKGTDRRVAWYLWPFHALWRLLGSILELTGRVVGVVLGLVLLILGIVISLTVVGAVVGAPLAILGLLLVVRGLF